MVTDVASPAYTTMVSGLVPRRLGLLRGTRHLPVATWVSAVDRRLAADECVLHRLSGCFTAVTRAMARMDHLCFAFPGRQRLAWHKRAVSRDHPTVP